MSERMSKGGREGVGGRDGEREKERGGEGEREGTRCLQYSVP